MPNYVCESGHTFVHPAKIVKKQLEPLPDGQMQTIIWELVPTFESYVCPVCKSINYAEAPDRQPEAVQVTGDWATVNKLLAEGWIIKASYSKEYHLWKCKP